MLTKGMCVFVGQTAAMHSTTALLAVPAASPGV
jgi:hypothetical protein